MPKSKSLAQRDAAIEKSAADAQEAEATRIAQAHTEDAMRALVEIATATKRKLFPNEEGYFEIELDEEGQPIRERFLPGPRVTAAKAILEHGHGRPTQQAQARGDGLGGGIMVVIHQYSDGKLEAIDVTPKPAEVESGDSSPELLDS